MFSGNPTLEEEKEEEVGLLLQHENCHQAHQCHACDRGQLVMLNLVTRQRRLTACVISAADSDVTSSCDYYWRLQRQRSPNCTRFENDILVYQRV